MKFTWEPGITLYDATVYTILLALRHYKGNKSMVARRLKITHKTVRSWCTRDDRLAEFRGDTRTKFHKLKDIPVLAHGFEPTAPSQPSLKAKKWDAY
jgi:hypothetical protein